MIDFACPSCGRAFHVKDEFAGKNTKCPKCETRFVIPNPAVVEHDSIDEEHETQESREQNHTNDEEEARPRKRVLRFEGRWTPSSVVLFHDESILGEFAAGLWDLGVVGWLLGYKRRMVLTTHRLFSFDKRIFINRLEIVWLEHVQHVIVGQAIKMWTFLFGLFCLFGSTYAAVTSIFSGSKSMMERIGILTSWFFGVLVGAIVLLLSREKVLIVSTGVDKTGLRLTRIDTAETTRFV